MRWPTRVAAVAEQSYSQSIEARLPPGFEVTTACAQGRNRLSGTSRDGAARTELLEGHKPCEDGLEEEQARVSS